jgi:hypothetical protein
MLQLIISILLSLGFQQDPKTSQIKANEETIDIIKSQPTYKDLGGDGALNEIIIIDNTDPKE